MEHHSTGSDFLKAISGISDQGDFGRNVRSRSRWEAPPKAIGTHRARRSRGFVEIPLDDIPGVGLARKRALPFAFGPAKAVARAGLADLEKTPGLNAATAKLV